MRFAIIEIDLNKSNFPLFNNIYNFISFNTLNNIVFLGKKL